MSPRYLFSIFFCILLFSASYYFERNEGGWWGNGETTEIVGTTLDGSALKLSDYRGKVVLLTFWSSENSRLRELFAYEQKLRRRFDGQPFVLLGVNTDSSQADAKAAATKYSLEWPSWYDGADGPIAGNWDVNDVSTVYVIDHKGVVQGRYERLPSHEEVESSIEALLKKAAGK